MQRSLYSPLHSVAAFGKRAREIVELMPNSSFGNNSVFSYLADMAEKVTVLHINCNINDGMAFFHYLEERYSVCYREWKKLHGSVLRENEKETLTLNWFAKKGGYTISTQKYALEFENSRYVKRYTINHSAYLVYSLADFMYFFEGKFEKNKNFALNL